MFEEGVATAIPAPNDTSVVNLEIENVKIGYSASRELSEKRNLEEMSGVGTKRGVVACRRSQNSLEF